MLINNQFNVHFFLTLETKFICLYVYGPWGLNISSLVEDISRVNKSSITLPIFVLLLCGHDTNDMNGSWR